MKIFGRFGVLSIQKLYSKKLSKRKCQILNPISSLQDTLQIVFEVATPIRI